MLRIPLDDPIGELPYTVIRSHIPVKVSNMLVAFAPAVRCEKERVKKGIEKKFK